MLKIIDLMELTNSDNIANLDIFINIKPWNYGANTSINNGGYIVYLENTNGYKVYAEQGGFDIDQIKLYYDIEALSDDEQYQLFEILDSIISSL